MIGFKKASGVMSRLNQAGLGLIELMISITIGLMIMAGVIQLYVTSVQTEQGQEGLSRIQENMRYAMTRLEKDISQSGFMGCLVAFENSDRIHNVLGDQSATNERNSFERRIDGFDGTEAMGSDELFIRYASAQGTIPLVTSMSSVDADVVLDDSFTAYDNLEQYQVVMLSDCSKAAVFMITNIPGPGGVLEHQALVVSTGSLNKDQFNTTDELGKKFSAGGQSGKAVARLYSGTTTGAHSYRIDTSAAGTASGGVCAAATSEFCALFRDDSELIEGVEDFQLEYGVSTGNSVKFITADVVTTAEWNLVDRLRVTLVFNSVQSARTLEGQDLMTKTATKVIMVRNELPAS